VSYLIVGLGNLGARYQNTRHNAGWHVIDAFARKRGWVFHSSSECRGVLAHGKAGNQGVFLLKPHTMMNLSGEAVKASLKALQVPLSNLLIVSDDTAFACGTVRLRSQGSDGGHNGLKSVEECLQTQYYARLRVGVGAPEQEILSDYVLSPFTEEQERDMQSAVERSVGILDVWLERGLATAMQIANTVTAKP
jgi:PTH1 family peptidyl-tRNA hydrolase